MTRCERESSIIGLAKRPQSSNKRATRDGWAATGTTTTRSSMASARVLIVGGGPAGYTLARTLHQQKVPFRLFDPDSGPRPDRGLGLWNRSQQVLRALGTDTVLGGAHFIPPAAYRSRKGDWLSRCSDSQVNRTRVATVLESALLASLADGLPHDSLAHGVRVISVRESADHVTLTLDDGSQETGSLVVGADGTHSVVRRCAFGAAAAAVETGLVSFSGLLPPSAIAKADEGQGTRAKLRPEALSFETLSAGTHISISISITISVYI